MTRADQIAQVHAIATRGAIGFQATTTGAGGRDADNQARVREVREAQARAARFAAHTYLLGREAR